MPGRIYTVGNMVEIPDDKLVSRHDKDDVISFMGKMDTEPNVIAVNYFAHEIFPKLKVKFTNLKFKIVGSHPERILSLSEIPDIEVTGFVDSLEPYYQNSTIVVAPMLTGAGIQNKIIQAMSYGCCVATTPIGAEGLTINNNEIAIIDDTDKWIETISNLLQNRDDRIEMGMKAREYVRTNLSPEIISKQFWDFIKSGGIEI